jgi:diguanylate cyclase (GGDEF)-like protein
MAKAAKPDRSPKVRTNRGPSRRTQSVATIALILGVLCALVTALTLPQRPVSTSGAETRAIQQALDTEMARLGERLRTQIASLTQSGGLDLVDGALTPEALENIRKLSRLDAIASLTQVGHLDVLALRQDLSEDGLEPAVRRGIVAAAKERTLSRDRGLPVDLDADGPPSGRVRHVGLKPAFVVIVDETYGASGLPPIVIVQYVTDWMLMTIENALEVRGLRVADPKAKVTANTIDIRGIDGAIGSRIVWESERVPETSLTGRIAAGASAVLSLIAIGAYVRLRRALHAGAPNSAETMARLGLDPLTNLPIRTRFTELLTEETALLGPGRPGIAVLFIDLDKFKDVNDTFGHAAGDKLLAQCADRMRKLIGPEDTLARFGGDEFAVIQRGVSENAQADALCKVIIDAVRAPFVVDQIELFVGVSIGVAMAPQHSSQVEEIMRYADMAMFQAKGSGRNRAVFFQPKMDEALKIRKLVEDDLRNAIDRDELQLYYQPQVSADGSHIVGVEGLIRWFHPTQGYISPVQFISVAEERGLIVPLGEWVVRRACRDGLRWPGITVAANVSALQFRQPDFVDVVARVLAETGFDPSRLELELTEGVVVEDAELAEQCIMNLRGMGIRLALDDFGTGYSSLIYLRRFAFDKIKIDKSFLDSMEATGESAVLVHSVVHLGRALGLTVTAEGVETPEQHRFLQAVGCHLLQGYLFSKPVPAIEIDKMLAAEAEGRAMAADSVAA